MGGRLQFISAGAGSGKTYKLTEILHRELREGGVRPEGVLATTFTNKAASELRERVRSHLIAKGSYGMANAIGQARIGTVNSVCGELLKRFAFEAGLPTEQRVLDDAQGRQLLREAIDFVIEEHALDDLLKVARRLSLDEVPLGKEDPAYRDAIRGLVDQARSNAIGPDELKSFGELNADHLLALFPEPWPGDLDASLLAAIREAVPSVRAAARGGKQNTNEYLRLIENAQRELAEGRMTWAQWGALAKKAPEKALQATVAPITALLDVHPRHAGLRADLRSYLNGVFNVAADALDAYAKLKKVLGALDFTDQERLLLDILDQPTVAEALTEELDLLMVDEFQDTSPIQLALFLKLAGFAKKVVWVGDIKQAIYGFRGSDTALMKSVLGALPDLGGSKDVLPHSWRSRPALVALVNQVFGEVFAGLVPEEVKLQARREELPDTAAVEDWILEGKNQGIQQSALASTIGGMIERGVEIEDPGTRERRPVRFADIAVLARSNATVTAIAGALRARGIPSSTTQPGLLSRPEVVLAVALLRRLADERDTLATAEIVSLADCEDPERWLADRLAWLVRGGIPSKWKEEPGPDAPAHPLLLAVKELRAQAALLSPREAVEMTITRCGLARRVIQWQQDAELARLRLANLDRLVELTAEYEEECATTRSAASLPGLLLWFQDLADGKEDFLPQPAIDAVQVMTHHKAKGLEWPVVVLWDLAGEVRDRVWDIRALSLSAFDARNPLKDRFLRYWPWPLGRQSTGLIADLVEASEAGMSCRTEAVEEEKRILYVSMTRARDVIVLARNAKKTNGEWMDTVALDGQLPANDDGPILLREGGEVPFLRLRVGEAEGGPVVAETSVDLAWFEEPARLTSRPSLVISPSAVEGATATVVETVALGQRLDTKAIDDRSVLGDAVHACIAADLASPGKPLGAAEVQAILDGAGIASAVDADALIRQLAAIREWIARRWPGARPVVELPMVRLLESGQRVAGRTDLVLRTATGWVLMDHKTTPLGSAHWEELAMTHAGQLAAYRDVIEAVSGVGVEEVWLVLPVAGTALRVEVRG